MKTETNNSVNESNGNHEGENYPLEGGELRAIIEAIAPKKGKPQPKAKPPKHFLDDTQPRYWDKKGYWRVRAMKEGKSFQWLMKQGRHDPSATGKVLAIAEWQKLKAEIKAQEQGSDDSEYEADGTPKFVWDMSEAAQAKFWKEHGKALYWREKYDDSGLEEKGYTLEDFKIMSEALDFANNRSAYEKKLEAVMEGKTLSPLEALPPNTKPFSLLIDAFKADVERRYKDTVNRKAKGLKHSEDISYERKEAYLRYCEYMTKKVGDTQCTPLGKYHVDEETLSAILAKFKSDCEKDFATAKNSSGNGVSGHWFNERMKTARRLTQFLKDNRLVNAEPPNIDKLTEKYETKKNPLPIPLAILRAIYAAADEYMRGMIRLALNCGLRQTEIANLETSHVVNLGGQVAIEKARGKTGVLFALPLWSEVQAFIEKHGNKDGLVFLGEKGLPLVHEHTNALSLRFKRLRDKVAKTMPEVLKYSFENFRDTGGSFMDTVCPMLTPLYLGHGDGRTARFYVGKIVDELPPMAMPNNMGEALTLFRNWLALEG